MKKDQGQRGAEKQVDQTEQKPALKQPKVLYVWDTTAAPGALRTHEVIAAKNQRTGAVLTKSYPLSNDKACPMPAAHALQFLRDEAFVVSISDDIDRRDIDRVKPVKQRVEQVNVLSLSENETIADWSELSDDALLRRAMVCPVDEKPETSASREDLIAFLTSASRKKQQDGDRLAAEGGVEGLAPSEIDKLFGGDRNKGINNNPMKV